MMIPAAIISLREKRKGQKQEMSQRSHHSCHCIWPTQRLFCRKTFPITLTDKQFSDRKSTKVSTSSGFEGLQIAMAVTGDDKLISEQNETVPERGEEGREMTSNTCS